MDNHSKFLESLLERAAIYGKTSYELVKLNVVDKTTDSLSTFLPSTLIFAIFCSFLLFANLGLALWIGQLFGAIYWGFFIVAAFYALIFLILHFVMRKWLKRMLRDYMIKLVFKN